MESHGKRCYFLLLGFSFRQDMRIHHVSA